VVRKIESLVSASTTLDAYLRAIAAFPQLTPDVEQSLSRQFQQDGDEAALDRLVRANLRFVARYASRYEGLGVSLLDLIHAGNEALAVAARRFNPTEPGTLRAHALWWIRQAVLHALAVSPAQGGEAPVGGGRFGTSSPRFLAGVRVSFDAADLPHLPEAHDTPGQNGASRRSFASRIAQPPAPSARYTAVLHGHLN